MRKWPLLKKAVLAIEEVPDEITQDMLTSGGKVLRDEVEKSGRPIVPIGIVNSDNIFENNGAFRKIRPATVYLNIGEPIYFDTLSEDQQKHIDVYVQGIVKDLIADLKKEC